MLKFIIAAAAAAVFSCAAEAADIPVDVRINGEYLLMDSAPYISEDRVYAPIRAISEALGAFVDWDAESYCASISHEGDEIKLFTKSDTVYVNGEQTQGKGLHIKNDRTMVPVRFVSNLLNADVEWDEYYRYVEVNKDDIELESHMTDYTYTHDEVYWLARIIHAESQGESMAGKIAVGDVILNRRKSPEFPNTIYGVIFDTKHGVQFEPVINGSIYNTPGAESVAAAKIALKNESSVGECLYFFAPKLATSSWIERNRQYYTTIGNHVFYL